jgi:hypothetical protein
MFAGPDKNRELIFPHQGFPKREQGFFSSISDRKLSAYVGGQKMPDAPYL